MEVEQVAQKEPHGQRQRTKILSQVSVRLKEGERGSLTLVSYPAAAPGKLFEADSGFAEGDIRRQGELECASRAGGFRGDFPRQEEFNRTYVSREVGNRVVKTDGLSTQRKTGEGGRDLGCVP